MAAYLVLFYFLYVLVSNKMKKNAKTVQIECCTQFQMEDKAKALFTAKCYEHNSFFCDNQNIHSCLTFRMLNMKQTIHSQ